jgi:hypothetical protein
MPSEHGNALSLSYDPEIDIECDADRHTALSEPATGAVVDASFQRGDQAAG